MEPGDLAIRIEKLERESRLCRLAAAASAAGLLAVLLASAQGRTDQDPVDVVEARRIRLVDGSGLAGVEIDASSLTLTRGGGGEGERVRCRLGPEGLEVLAGSEEEPRAVLEVNTREIDLVDYAREKRAVIQPALFGLQNGIHGASERPVSWVRVQGAGLEVEDEEGRVVWRAP